MNFIAIDPEKSTLKEVHNLLLGGVAPRPVALVSTISEDGINNLAPFSFFNAFGANPPYVAFSPAFSGRDGSAKDTYNNLKKIPECVVQVVTYDLVHQVSLSSTAYKANVDEFIKGGFTPIDSDIVKPKRVKESPLHMECKAEQIISLGGKNASGNLVICKVVKFHVSDHLFRDGIIDPHLIDLVGRNSSNYYTRASGNAIFEVKKPRGIGIDIDQLPQFIKESKILSANNLGQLGNVSSFPNREETQAFLKSCKKIEISAENIINMRDDDNYTNVFNAGYSFWQRDPVKAKDLMETAAKKALDTQDVDFGILALQSIEFLTE